MGRKQKQLIAIVLTLAMFLQSTGLWQIITFADYSGDAEPPEQIVKFWCGETTDEILKMMDEENLDLSQFFQGDLSAGITREDLQQWKSEGKDINDVIFERARANTSTVKFQHMDSQGNETSSWIDENGKAWQTASTSTYLAPPITDTYDSAGNPMYYLTYVGSIEGQNGVNLSGTPYENWLHNPKTGMSSQIRNAHSWYLTLGYANAMCATYGGGADCGKDYHFLEKPISNLTKNPYFNGGNDYPVERYYRGAAFAYERLMGMIYPELTGHISDSVTVHEANLSSLYHALETLTGSDDGKNYLKTHITAADLTACFQIISWRIAGGDFANGLASENEEAEFGRFVYHGMYNNLEKSKIMKEVYRYFIHCAEGSSHGDKDSLYNCVSVKYFEIQGNDNIKTQYQDFVTWDVAPNTEVPSLKITIDKVGNALVKDNKGIKYPYARFTVFSDPECKNYVTDFITFVNGSATLNLTPGDYYIKETEAPKGMVKSNEIMHLSVRDHGTSTFIYKNDEIYNYLVLKKFSSNFREEMKEQATLELHEVIDGKQYKVTDLAFTKTPIIVDGKNISAFSYYIPISAIQQYHDNKGITIATITGSKFYYSKYNEGNFQVVEKAAPAGYSINESGLKVKMDLSGQGKLLSYTSYANGLREDEYNATVQFRKYDTLSQDELSGAAFELQEKVNGRWLKVGDLIWDTKTRCFTTAPHITYIYHTKSFEQATVKMGEYPLIRTPYNNGMFKIAETKTPNDNYPNLSEKEFTVAPKQNNYTYLFTTKENGICNTGKFIRVKTAKYDAITKEQVVDSSATIRVFEYNKGIGEWQSVGDLVYNEETGLYECDKDVYYTPHTKTGQPSIADKNNYEKGKLYYTSINEGQYKLVETVAPKNYELGLKTGSAKPKVYEVSVYIDPETEEGAVYDFTEYEKAAVDTPINVKLNLAKFDKITKEKVTKTNAEFTVYERVNEKWLETGKLIYDENSEKYVATGMKLTLHDSTGKEVYSEEKAKGLYYTSANKGQYKIVETKAPDNYIRDSYVKEINMNQAENGVINLTSLETAAMDTGIRGTVKINKFDAATEELVRTGDMTATVYEKINGKWFPMGILKYDEKTKFYGTAGADLKYHNLSGKEIKTINGYLYYTSANNGQFKIVETVAPKHYTLTSAMLKLFSKEIILTKNNQEFVYADPLTAIRNYGVKATIRVNKYDSITKEIVSTKNASFDLEEYVEDKKQWMKVGTMRYEKDAGFYVSDGTEISLHNKEGKVIHTNKEGYLYYTTQNLGKYRIVETKAPDNYVKNVYIKEFHITELAKNGVIDFTSLDNSAKDIGISEVLGVAKLDRVTNERVQESDAEFTVYEQVSGKWLETGKLAWNEERKYYATTGVKFVFHDQEGKEIDTADIQGYSVGRLYYTTANRGHFKVVETKAPTNYTQEPFTNETKEIYEKEFLVNQDNEMNLFTTKEDSARNTGVSAQLKLLKYDFITKKNVMFKDAVFNVEESVNGNWKPVGHLIFDEKTGVYTTKGMEVYLHNSKGDVTYHGKDGKLYYTNVNKGNYRVVEAVAPSNYILGSAPYKVSFNILNAKENLINLTDEVKGAKDLGIRGTVNVSKYDLTTRELVRTNDTEFTVYEKINNKWLESGKLVWNEKTKSYDTTGVTFVFHKEDGSVADVKDIPDFINGVLYYTTANKGIFKVAETKAPTNYTKGNFEKEFQITKNDDVIRFNSKSDGALNEGIRASLELKKYDILTKKQVKEGNAGFLIEEYIADTKKWESVGYMQYDEKTKSYTTKGMSQRYHQSSGKYLFTLNEDELIYTSANLGKFRVTETYPPSNYELNVYMREFNIKDAVNGKIVWNNYKEGAKDIGISGTTKVVKFDKITGEKVLTGDAEFTVYEKIGKEWLETGKLIYDEKAKEYTCTGATFTFHCEDKSVIDTSDIKEFGLGLLYYTTANKGQFKVVETKAPKNYLIDGFEKEFNILNHKDNNYTDINNAASDTGFAGELKLAKSDKFTDTYLAGATFAVQEWSESHQTWLKVGNLTDHGDGFYTTEGMEAALHTGKDAATVEVKSLHYTTQNLGKYRVVEEKAPEGYLNDLYVSDELLIEQDKQVIDLTSDNLKAEDTPIRVSVSKTSVTNGKPVIGATLKVVDSVGNVIDTWVTDGTEHMISAIPAGKYTLIEERASDGYIIAANVNFEVKETGEIQKVVMQDEEVRGKLEIHKKDKKTGRVLEGAVFELRDETGNVVDTLTTDKDGYAVSEEIHFGIYAENGVYQGSRRYYLVEVKAPEGYELDATPVKIVFEYQDDKTSVVVKTVELTNKPTEHIPPVTPPTPPTVKTGDSVSLTPVILLMISILVLFITVWLKKEEN